MDIFEFLDIKFQEVSIANGKEYSVFKDGRAKAIHSVINLYRSLAKWVSIPVLIFECVAMKLKWTSEPISPLKLAAIEEKAKIESSATTNP